MNRYRSHSILIIIIVSFKVLFYLFSILYINTIIMKVSVNNQIKEKEKKLQKHFKILFGSKGEEKQGLLIKDIKNLKK